MALPTTKYDPLTEPGPETNLPSGDAFDPEKYTVSPNDKKSLAMGYHTPSEMGDQRVSMIDYDQEAIKQQQALLGQLQERTGKINDALEDPFGFKGSKGDVGAQFHLAAGLLNPGRTGTFSEGLSRGLENMASYQDTQRSQLVPMTMAQLRTVDMLATKKAQIAQNQLLTGNKQGMMDITPGGGMGATEYDPNLAARYAAMGDTPLGRMGMAQQNALKAQYDANVSSMSGLANSYGKGVQAAYQMEPHIRNVKAFAEDPNNQHILDFGKGAGITDLFAKAIDGRGNLSSSDWANAMAKLAGMASGDDKTKYGINTEDKKKLMNYYSELGEIYRARQNAEGAYGKEGPNTSVERQMISAGAMPMPSDMGDVAASKSQQMLHHINYVTDLNKHISDARRQNPAMSMNDFFASVKPRADKYSEDIQNESKRLNELLTNKSAAVDTQMGTGNVGSRVTAGGTNVPHKRPRGVATADSVLGNVPAASVEPTVVPPLGAKPPKTRLRASQVFGASPQ